MRRQRRNAFIILGVGAAIGASIAVAGAWGGYRLNMTRSFPIGLWRIEMLQREPHVGDTVFICPPKTPAFDLALERGYLPRGLCPGGTGPLIKTVAALAGQDVAIGGRVRVDGRLLDHSELRLADPAGSIFLHSKFPGSYDSRYFGSVPADGILGLAKPVFTFAP